jgi:hypothetical protein
MHRYKSFSLVFGDENQAFFVNVFAWKSKDKNRVEKQNKPQGGFLMSNIALQIELLASGLVNVGSNVIFDTVVYSAGNIIYNSVTGVITFNEAGRYALNWWSPHRPLRLQTAGCLRCLLPRAIFSKATRRSRLTKLLALGL